MKIIKSIIVVIMIITCLSCDKVTSYNEEYVIEGIDSNLILNPTSEYFVVFGDTQIYTYDEDLCEYYKKSVDWIIAQSNLGNNIQAVLQLGDITNNNLPYQWDLFYNATKPLADSILFVSCIGNHDYTWNNQGEIDDRYDTFFSKYTSFDFTGNKIVASYEQDRRENVIVECSLHGEAHYIIALELGARKEVVEWANDYVSTHPKQKFFLITHEFLSEDGKREKACRSYALNNTTQSSPEEIWNSLVKINDNIICVLCGHNGFYAHLFSRNDSNYEVPQVLFNLQFQEKGGGGMVQLWEFPSNREYVNVSIYNTVSQQFIVPCQLSFKIPDLNDKG